jgi:hypothetical protein
MKSNRGQFRNPDKVRVADHPGAIAIAVQTDLQSAAASADKLSSCRVETNNPSLGLLVPQCHHGINLGCPPRRDVTGDQGNRQQDRRH